ncbi:hypothetical protein [Microbacterium deminutum]|uniref:Uncharacterized protein n=1 Tax=Microbacterium deminutum TaxID=344164 RepID=A0ABN2Q4K0_9MICO
MKNKRMDLPDDSSSRRSFLRGFALVGAATITRAAAGGVPAQAAESTALAGDGMTDDGPALQRIFDAGRQPEFVSNRTYLLNSPVFLDRPSSLAMFVLELNGATLLLGPRLPTTDAFWRDKATRWAFFPNTVRRALSDGQVNVSPGTRASGTGTGALVSLIVRDGTVEGRGANAGFAFANRTGAKFESVVLHGARTLLSWHDYSDANVFLQCHNREGGRAGSVLVEQISPGDGLRMESCKSDAAVGLARLKYCRGAEIVGTVTGRIELEACSAIQIRGGHQETPIVNETIIDIRSSDVVIDTTALYLARGRPDEALPPAVRITDTGTPASSVVLRDCTEVRALVTTDEKLGNVLSIDRAVLGTRVEARGLTSVVSVRKKGGVWSKSVGSSMGGSGGVSPALASSLDTVATGDFRLSNPGTGWVVAPTTPTPSFTGVAPTISGLAATDDIGGTLGSAGYRYRAQGRLPGGKLTPASDFSPVVASRSGALRFLVLPGGGPQELRIWRFLGASTTPNGYLDVAAASTTHTIYDTGSSANGFLWKPGTAKAAP